MIDKIKKILYNNNVKIKDENFLNEKKRIKKSRRKNCEVWKNYSDQHRYKGKG